MDYLENLNPNIYKKSIARQKTDDDFNENVIDEIDAREIFDILREIKDPEHPLTLEQLHVIEEKNINVDNKNNLVHVYFTPTIPHCSMATLIGLCIRVLLLRTLPPRLKVTVEITPGTHASENSINKQLADKERVAAALENQNLMTVIQQCLDMELKNDYEDTNSEFQIFTNNFIKNNSNVVQGIDSEYECRLVYFDSLKSHAVDLKRKYEKLTECF